MRRTYVGVSEGDSVAGAARLMNEDGVESAVVIRGPDPIGMLTAGDVMGVIADGGDPETTAVDAAMRRPVASVAPGDGLEKAIGAMADHDVHRLAVVSEGSLVGTVTEHDIVTVPSSFSSTGTAESTGEDDPVPERTNRDPGPGSDTYTIQSVCEVCGSLSRSLDPHNGQLVCEDCRAM
jgi:signal-transduction protein with cAMP-binding, CBS, and nucleotidyltransferase domain